MELPPLLAAPLRNGLARSDAEPERARELLRALLHARAATAGSRARRAYAALQRAYLRSRYGATPPKLAERLVALLLRLHPGRRVDADFLAMFSRAVPGGRLLDVGCGEGHLLTALAELGWSVRGLDFDPAAVAAARSRGHAVDAGTLESAGYPDASLDAVTASHVLEHVPEPLAFLAECRRVLAPGGRLVAVTPNAKSLGHRVFGRAWRGLEPPRHLQLFTRASLAELARRAGFERAGVKLTVRNARGVELASRALRRAERRGFAEAVVPEPDLRAELFQALEWSLALFAPELGEELVLVARVAAGGLHRGAGSPRRDAGDPAFVALPGELDLDGEPRVFGPAVDQGADEDRP